jgi:hypothetical protein
VAKQEDLSDRSAAIFTGGNMLVNPLSSQLHIVCTPRILDMRNKLVVDDDGNNTPLGEEVSDVGVALKDMC